jgi:hypothetical protein
MRTRDDPRGRRTRNARSRRGHGGVAALLAVALRVISAPFYAAGLIVRYGFYTVLVAPFEVLFRTIDYGASGGVDPNSAPTQGP